MINEETVKRQCKTCGLFFSISEFKGNGVKCKECYRVAAKKLREIKKEAKKEYDRLYRKQNIEKIKENSKKYYIGNKNAILKRTNEYRKSNPEKIMDGKKKYYQKSKKDKNNDFWSNKLRHRVYLSLAAQKTRKINKTQELIGCSVEFLKQYLESKFKPGMSWDNYGYRGWHIDHIRPLSSFDLTNLDQQKIAFHYTNLQPLWAEENLAKSDGYGYN
jgi:hypothetical protein